MTWITNRSWTCDGCGESFEHDRPWAHRRLRNRAHVPFTGARDWGIATKYVHYCSDACVEEPDAKEVVLAMGNMPMGRGARQGHE